MHLPLVVALILLFLTSVPVPAPAEQGMAIDPATCLGCHSNKISVHDFANSVHGKNACTSCHIDITNLLKHMKKEIKVQKVQCERCHKKQNSEHYASVHAEKGVTCAQCHTDAHTHNYWKNDKRIAVAKCILVPRQGSGLPEFGPRQGGTSRQGGLRRLPRLPQSPRYQEAGAGIAAPRIRHQGLPEVPQRPEDDGQEQSHQCSGKIIHGELPRQELPSRLP